MLNPPVVPGGQVAEILGHVPGIGGHDAETVSHVGRNTHKRHTIAVVFTQRLKEVSVLYHSLVADAVCPITLRSGRMLLSCPRCRSTHIETLDVAAKIGGSVGAVAGAAGGVAATFAGVETGALVGSILGPVGSVLGGLAGAVLGGLFGAATGCAAGTALGETVDSQVLCNHRCLDCGHTFRTK